MALAATTDTAAAIRTRRRRCTLSSPHGWICSVDPWSPSYAPVFASMPDTRISFLRSGQDHDMAASNQAAGAGEFVRDENYISTRITADGQHGYPVESDRYRLVVARACPWANRAVI